MAVDLRCPNCEDNLGKDTENVKVVTCGTCGHTFYNPRGDGELDEADKKWLKENNVKVITKCT